MKNRTKNLFHIGNRIWLVLTISLITICSALFAEPTVRPGDVLTTNDKSLVMTDSLSNDSIADWLQNYMDSVERIKSSLIEEVENYIISVAPRSKMSAENIVELCIEHDFDITLLLSQGHLETHFATTSRSNNCFGLYKKRYSHPDKAVIDYISLMKRCYIINRTTEQVLASNVRMERNRRAQYSGNARYGKELSKIRTRIIRETEIMNLFEDLQEMNSIIENYTS